MHCVCRHLLTKQPATGARRQHSNGSPDDDGRSWYGLQPIGSGQNGIVATTPFFAVGFCLGRAPLSHVVAAEIPTTGLRDYTYALGSVFNIINQWAVAFSIP